MRLVDSTSFHIDQVLSHTSTREGSKHLVVLHKLHKAFEFMRCQHSRQSSRGVVVCTVVLNDMYNIGAAGALPDRIRCPRVC